MYSNIRVIPLLQEIGVAEANGEVRFLTRSSQIDVSAHVQGKHAQNLLIMLSNSHNISPFIGNRGR